MTAALGCNKNVGSDESAKIGRIHGGLDVPCGDCAQHGSGRSYAPQDRLENDLMDLRKKPMYLSGNSRSFRKRRYVANFGTLLFVGGMVAVNYFVFLKDDSPGGAPPLERRINQEPATTAADSNAVGGAAIGDSSAAGAPGGSHPSGPAPTEPPPEVAPTPTPTQPNREQRLEAPGRNNENWDNENWEDEEGAVLAGRLKRGQTVLQALTAEGVEASAMYSLIAEMEKVFDFRHARVGDRFSLRIDGLGRIARLEYETSPLDRYVVERLEDGTYNSLKMAVHVDSQVAEVGCELRSSLYASVKRCGEDGQLASRIVDVFAWDLDFFQDARDGDRFKLLVEKKYVDGAFLSYGRILAAEYVGSTGKHQVVWFEHDEAGDEAATPVIAGYYKTDGTSVRKEFLKTPLKYTRVSSGYTHHQFHPVLHRYKKHLGVDYAAPEKSPVWAVAGGTVTFVGEKGANGNLVSIRHANGYTSYYAHLHAFADGLEVGDQIDQKEVLGYVGSTGRTKSPHLHFALKHRDRFVDPQKIKYTSDNPVPTEALPDFMQTVRKLSSRLEAIPVAPSDKERT